MERRRLWELSCPIKDAVLWTSLDVREALGIAERSGLELEFPEGTSRDVPHAVAGALHRLCHSRNPFSKKVEAMLDGFHEDAMRVVEAASLEELGEWLRRDLADLPLPYAGFAWALARDPRPEVRRLETALGWRLQLEGFRALAFGKVELIEVGR